MRRRPSWLRMLCRMNLLSMRHLHDAAEILAEFFLIFVHFLHAFLLPRAILHFACKLAAGGVDIIAARLTHGCDDACIDQFLLICLFECAVGTLESRFRVL